MQSMNRRVRGLVLQLSLLAVVLINLFTTVLCAQTVPAQFNLVADGAEFPTLRGSTNLPDGTKLFVNLKKPWLKDAQERLAQGRAACGEDCLPAIGPDGQFGFITAVQKGTFSAGPFSFAKKRIVPGVYPVEISIYYDIKMATMDQLKSMKTPVFSSAIEIGSARSTNFKRVEGAPQDQRDTRKQFINPSAASREDKQAIYRSKYFLAGFLLRAGNACNFHKANLGVAFALISSEELKNFSGAFPDTTERWMTEGASNFNSLSIKDGLASTCDYANTTLAQATELAKQR